MCEVLSSSARWNDRSYDPGAGWRAFFFLAITAFPLLSATAAGREIPLSVSAPAIPPPVVQRIPVRVGLCLSPVLRGAVIVLEKQEAILEPLGSENRERKRWDLGNAVAATLVATMRASFEDVTIVDNCAPNTAATGDLQAIVIAQLLDARVVLPGLQATLGEYLGRREGHIDLLVTLRSAAGRPSLTWSVSASGFAEHALLSTQDDVAIALSAALRTASARLLADLSLNSMVHAWFASIGVHGESAGASQIAGFAQGGSHEDAAISTSGKIAIVSNGLKEPIGMQTTQCLSQALESLDHGVRIIAEDQARDAFFPWFESDVLTTHSVDALSSQMVQERARRPTSSLLSFPPMLIPGVKGRGPSCVAGDTEALAVWASLKCSAVLRFPPQSGIFDGVGRSNL